MDSSGLGLASFLPVHNLKGTVGISTRRTNAQPTPQTVTLPLIKAAAAVVSEP